ncbi:hypothetical protein V6N13_050632 [Hibiscus sabdariffa]|uniref:Uncharacterized protein n=1 Tax=Hibiscus sabdariffa TaxID=183260 RepID=A0ABR2PHW3_9ROSI
MEDYVLEGSDVVSGMNKAFPLVLHVVLSPWKPKKRANQSRRSMERSQWTNGDFRGSSAARKTNTTARTSGYTRVRYLLEMTVSSVGSGHGNRTGVDQLGLLDVLGFGL